MQQTIQYFYAINRLQNEVNRSVEVASAYVVVVVTKVSTALMVQLVTSSIYSYVVHYTVWTIAGGVLFAHIHPSQRMLLYSH